jgi:hypothetical protein
MGKNCGRRWDMGLNDDVFSIVAIPGHSLQ